MDWIEAILLGLVQGLTEFLPISSTGHLYLGRELIGLKEAGLFLDTMLHLGTLIAVIVVYKNELWTVIKKPFGRLSLILIVGTIPAVAVGLLFKDYFEGISKTGSTIGWEFLITGFILWFSDRIKKGAKKLQDISYGDALFIGSFQAVAIFPAISRSGLTIVAGLFRKLDREVAAYFSFLLSVPVIGGAVLLQLVDLLQGKGLGEVTGSALLIATIASALAGFIAVKWMISYLKKGSLKWFAVYVWTLGLSVLLMQNVG
ncbi:undecaprenyl-diphosphate phosphatase [Bacillus horti]|uniref:Undecaprenyl-diphosphatase n=1 Tax=Caldalkalibacillus horti TaxID=77523 RepID=A0ABT9VTD9_9BACI|nr:undecaprenyl-diphosphate phosphatase [Bacillus horti]MDQ0164242.1 undecaprenyl-diphosphatase [Bacillus horti]